MRLEERIEELRATLDELAEANLTKPILVEGKRDVEALRELGCLGEILVLHAGDHIIEVADRIARTHREVVLLTDWDRKGGQLARLVQDNLRGRVKLDTELRKRLARFAAVKDVESLPSHLRMLERELAERVRT